MTPLVVRGFLFPGGWLLTRALAPAASLFTLTGPPIGPIGSASQPFGYQPNSAYTGTITLSMTGLDGTWSPTTLTWSGTAEVQTATFTATVAGTGTANGTADPALTQPADLTYISGISGGFLSISTFLGTS